MGAPDPDIGILDVTVVLLDGGFSSTAIMPIEVFHSAGALWRQLHGEAPEPRFRVTIATVDGQAVTSAYGLSLIPQASIDRIDKTDIIIVSTSALDLDGTLAANDALHPWLCRQHAQGAYVAGVCMAAAYLGQAGLLDGRMATTHWALAADFARRFPKAIWRPEMMVTEDGRVLCSGGVSASIDVSLYLVEKLCGHEVAVQCAKSLLINMPRVSQSGYAVLPLSAEHSDAPIRAVQAWLHEHCREDLSIDRLAGRAGMTARTFVRRFKAATGRFPGAYVQAARVELAKAMLERDAAPIQTVSSAVGYDNVAFFRALFKRATGMTPAQYRATFAATGAGQPAA